MVGNEEDVIKYYERFWTRAEFWWEADKTLTIHPGYYDKGIRSHTKAVLHMNDVAWQLLKFDGKKHCQILDAGCRAGGNLIYLAQKYPLAILHRY